MVVPEVQKRSNKSILKILTENTKKPPPTILYKRANKEKFLTRDDSDVLVRKRLVQIYRGLFIFRNT